MATTTDNFLGKCKEKGCDYVIFATGDDVRDAENFREVRAGAGVFKVGNNGRFARCTSGHKFFAVKAVKGTYSPDHQCDSRCLNAKGWSCTCSCGGANHGRGHVATIVQAADLDAKFLAERGIGPVGERRSAVHPSSGADTTGTTARIGKHLGEVGKHIRGEVKIARVISLNGGKVLYKFITEAGDNIDWFVPAEYNPHWEEGTTLTIRAKVIRHESHERFGNSTVVIYVEEVE